MLSSLLIKNYALIEHLEMEPSPHLNIITGETGAGKSIMLGAVGLMLGNRADTKVLFHDNQKCIIEGSFNIASYNLSNLFKQHDLDYEDITSIRREITPAGKSRAFINDTPVTLDILKSVGTKLMDVHSQHDTLLLGTNNFQLQLIDSYSNTSDIFDQYQNEFVDFKRLEKQLHELVESASKIKEEADYHQFLHDELEKAKLQNDEQADLEEELNILEHAEEIKSKLNQVLDLTNSSEVASSTTLQDAKVLLQSLSSYSEKLGQLSARTDNMLIELLDIIQEVEHEESLTEFDQGKTENTKDRLSLIYHLQQKHNVNSVEELLVIENDLGSKLEQAVNLDDNIAALAKKTNEYKAKMLKSGDRLSKCRVKVLKPIASEIEELLHALAIPEAKLEMIHSSIDPSRSGLDSIEVRFSANKGVEPQELKRVASGGEFSRLMLCIKYIMAQKRAMPTIIFDEIDTGVSGEIALKLGQMMKRMAKNHQIISISHLPQIAAKGDSHYFVYKDNSSERAISKIKVLENEQRVTAIAEMIGGDNPSATAFESAKELLAH